MAGVQKRRTEGLEELTLNGVNLMLVLPSAFDKYMIPDRHVLKIPGTKRWVYLPGLSRDKMYRAAGYDWNKIDPATPQSWFDLPENRARRAAGDRAVWSYEGKGNLGGRPVWDSEMKARLFAAIKRRLKARATGSKARSR
ncbi:MAG: hypothetical protein PHV57_07135 [Methanomicrobiaceae archaeon]|nr:hypothetical protein [Methanomicrobiaceae archaeon]